MNNAREQAIDKDTGNIVKYLQRINWMHREMRNNLYYYIYMYLERPGNLGGSVVP